MDGLTVQSAGLDVGRVWYNNYTIMIFEFDPDKSQANLEKHGIDFDQAQALWRDPDGLDVPSKYSHEARRLWIAARKGKLWTAIYTARAGNVRIISVRRSRENERNAYYER